MGLLDEMETEVPCPECGREFKVSLRQVQEEATVTCPGCKKQITLKSVGDDLSGIDKAEKNLEKTIRDANKKLKFNIKF